ncbi:MAG: tRNA (adenosine(37)-N6)-threonylcarbamoyltransferase complex ATPase subunit type 1 TsaE, partial [Gammaproteobacteria bacterium]
HQAIIIALTGDLGSGKTAFVQGLAKGLDVSAKYYITSPTFTLINEFPGRHPLYHVDLYMIFISILLFLGSLAPAHAQNDPVSEALHARLEELQFAGDLQIGGASIAGREILPAVYANREFQPMWTDADRIEDFLAMVETAPRDGLLIEDYFVNELRARMDRADHSGSPLDRADLDILLTESLVRFGYHQLFGKVDAHALDSNINFTRKFLDGRSAVVAIPEIIASSTPFQQQLENAVHRSPFYRALRKHLADYRQIAADGGWPRVPEGETLHPGDTDPRVAPLRQRLIVTGDLPAGSDTTSTTFDVDVKAAVIRFQERHALGADGVVGKNSYAALNVPVDTRVDQLRLSLERLRWVRGEREERFIAVNIAGFRVYFISGDGIAWTTRAMVGKTYRQTPIFRGTLSYMEVNPTWTVPPTILRKDVLPAIRKDPGYLQAKNMSVIDRNGRKVDPATIDWQAGSLPYSIRQEPGPNNALGEVKFIFPNKHFVFLHDTSHRSLFSQPERAFSSGCIRVQDPFTLAELIMNDTAKWDQAALTKVRDTHKTQRINTPKLPVLILYLTASLEPDGRSRFLKDVYERDAKLLAALDGEVVITPLGAE